MRCLKKLLKILLCGALLLPCLAQAGEISLRNAQINGGEEAYLLSVDTDITLNTRLEDAVSRGVILYFTADFELNRSRWYWFDEQVIQRGRTVQLSYHALTRQYRLSTGALHQTFPTLSEALRTLSRLRNWAVIDKSAVNPEQTYQASLRVRLDLSQMPKTFQVTALANRDWQLSSDWMRWNFNPSEILQRRAAEPVGDAVPASIPIVPVASPAPIVPIVPANAPAPGDSR